ncbi:MAG: restriction endonuclease subunit S [Bacteroidales bacterium]
MTNWKEYKLGEICSKVTSGGTPNTRKEEYYGGSIPWLRTQEINFNRLYDTEIKITEEGLSNSSAKWIPENSVIIAMYGATAGKVAVNKIPVTTNQACCNLIIDKEKADYRFIYYNILSRFSSIANMAIGGAQQNLNAGMIKELAINLPDLPTQTAIAEILSSLDDKIELNNKINQELENLAQTLFKQWFIDFEFPNENGEPYKSSGGELVDSELGEIPKGWEVKSLDEIANITIGRTPPRKEHQWFTENSSDVKWISIKDMGNCGTYIMNTSEYLTEAAVAKFNVPIIQKNTVIISFKLTVGRISITTERMLSNEAIAHLNLFDENINPEFIYLYLKQFDFDSLGSTSSIATAVNSKAIKALNFIYPDANILVNFQEQVSSIFEQILNTTKENQELTNLRDTLLPKLISGELEVAEVIAEKA